MRMYTMSTEAKPSKSSFINKLRHLLNDQKYYDIIRWSDDGTCVVIPDMVIFELEILPKVFNTTQASSFVRQMNLYGFRKKIGLCDTRNDTKYHIFAHPDFRRDRPDLSVISKPKKPNNSSVISSNLDRAELQSQIDELSLKLQEMTNIQTNLLQQNRIFYEDILSIRTKQDTQSDNITKILKFLYSFLGQGRKDVQNQPNKCVEVQNQMIGVSNINNGITLPTQIYRYQTPQQQQLPIIPQTIQIQPNLVANPQNINVMNQNYDPNFIPNSQINTVLSQPVNYNNSLLMYQTQDASLTPQFINLYTPVTTSQFPSVVTQNGDNLISLESSNIQNNSTSSDNFDIESSFINQFMQK